MTRPSLSSRLQGYITGLQVDRMQFGQPELVFKAVQQAEKLFQSFGHAQPSEQEAYAAALMLLKGKTLDARATHFVAAAVGIPIKEYAGKTLLESEYGDQLLDQYRSAIQQGKFSRLTWHVLLSSYFGFDPSRLKDPQGREAFEKLRLFLDETWLLVSRNSKSSWIPDWQRVLREERQLLGLHPMDRYAQDYLEGRHNHINHIALSLGVPPQSWFWEELVLGGIRHVAQGSDADFQAKLPVLIDLIKKAPVYRDQAIVMLLERFYQSKDRSEHAVLRDYVIRPDIWKNPKLKTSGIATAWHQVSDDVWRMVLGWVNKRNLRDFFDILAARGHADYGRLEFWSRYMEQITWTRLVIGPDTYRLRKRLPALDELLISEEGDFAILDGASRSLDAFLMELGDYIFVEFSLDNNGAYGYSKKVLPFNLYSKKYHAGTMELKYGYRKSGRGYIAIRHIPNWQLTTEQRLAEIGIFPDARNNVVAKKTPLHAAQTQHPPQVIRPPVPKPVDAEPVSLSRNKPLVQVEEVRMLAGQYAGVKVTENKLGSIQKIYVEDVSHNVQLGNYLKKMGFQWSNFMEQWYLSQNCNESGMGEDVKQAKNNFNVSAEQVSCQPSAKFFDVLRIVKKYSGLDVKEGYLESRDGGGFKKVILAKKMRPEKNRELVFRLKEIGFKWSSVNDCFVWVDE